MVGWFVDWWVSTCFNVHEPLTLLQASCKNTRAHVEPGQQQCVCVVLVFVGGWMAFNKQVVNSMAELNYHNHKSDPNFAAATLNVQDRELDAVAEAAVEAASSLQVSGHPCRRR